MVGLRARAQHRPMELSGGQQQRVAIARALVTGPSLLLADEPTGNLDSQTSRQVMAILQELNVRGLSIVLVTHEADIANYCQRQVKFRDGKVLDDAVNPAPAPPGTQPGASASPNTSPAPSAAQSNPAGPTSSPLPAALPAGSPSPVPGKTP